jgi:hypothetical protein
MVTDVINGPSYPNVVVEASPMDTGVRVMLSTRRVFPTYVNPVIASGVVTVCSRPPESNKYSCVLPLGSVMVLR